ncbi:MAG: hypothetical protein J6A59_01195 [Lachnospiraceae bacterium]|nr:hypothetical protein [Lachnospiraceae bacterium]
MNKETNELDYNINSISINTLNNTYVELQNITWLKNNLNTKSDYYMIENEEFLIDKNTQYGSFSITDTTVFIERINKQRTGNKELLLCNRLPYGINTNLMQRNGLRFKESSNPTQVKTLANSYDNSILMLSETLGGGKLSIESLQTPLLNMEYSMHKSDKLEGMYINFDEVGQLNIMEIPEVNNSPGIVYSKDDKILRVKNMSEDIEYIYISHINNEKFGCFAEDLIETTDEKLFVHMDYDNPNSIGYKTFAILSENNLYCFRINGLYHESLRLNIFEQLGIDMSEIEIKKIQRVIDNNEEH